MRHAGAEVWIADITETVAEGCHLRRTDVSQPDDIRGLCGELVKRHGRLDIYVNNAAIAGGRLLADAAAACPERFWRINQLGVQMGTIAAFHRSHSTEKTLP